MHGRHSEGPGYVAGVLAEVEEVPRMTLLESWAPDIMSVHTWSEFSQLQPKHTRVPGSGTRLVEMRDCTLLLCVSPLLWQYYHTPNTSGTWCVGLLPVPGVCLEHQWNVPQFILTPELAQIPQGRGSVLQDCPYIRHQMQGVGYLHLLSNLV